LRLSYSSPRELGPNDTAFWSSELSTALFGSIAIDISQLYEKQLNPEDDTKIWSNYAQELWTLFSNGDWRLISMWIDQTRRMPFEVCSPTMIQIYRRHITGIGAYLEELPHENSLWTYYSWTTSITKQGSTKTLLDRLVPLPGLRWPSAQALNLLASEEAAKGNWNFLAEIMMSNWPGFRLRISNPGIRISVENLPESMQATFYTGMLDGFWQAYLKLLLESLIRTNRISDAEAILFDVASIPGYGDFQRRAADLALRCDMSDLQIRWMTLQIPKKTDRPNMDDLTAGFYLNPIGITPRLALININEEESDESEKSNTQHIDAMLGQGRIADWRIERVFSTDPALSELMRQKEGWPKDTAYWGLFDSKSKLLAHGFGLPTEESLYQALNQYNVDTPANILRRFAREYPSHLQGKSVFLQELKRLAESKTKEKLKEDAGLNTERMLSDEEDQAIWGEYALLYRQVLPYFLNQGRPQGQRWRSNPCASDYFIHSRTMKNLAVWIQPQVEESLRCQPTNDFLWGAWITISDLIEGSRLFKNLQETLILSPMTDPINSVPADIRKTLLRRYAARERWQDVIDVQGIYWELFRERQKTTGLLPDGLTQELWSDETQYLLKAYLRLSWNDEADELVRIWSQSPVWPQIKQSVINLAEKTEKNTLVTQWKRR